MSEANTVSERREKDGRHMAVLLRRESDDALSAEGWAIYSAVRSGTPAAYVDLAQIGFFSPVREDDPGNHRLKAAALAAMWGTYRAAGVRALILCGRVESGLDVERYAAALADADTPLSVFEMPSDGDVTDIVREVRGRLG